MNVLVLGSDGAVGERLCKLLRGTGRVAVVAAAPRSEPALREALRGMDAVVHCVDRGGAALVQGTRNLVRAAAATGCPRIVHLGSQAAYGAAEGIVDEHAQPGRGAAPWREAEALLVGYGAKGGTSVLLRAGCVWGARAGTWSDRLAHWLRAGRLGDLGVDGDGWSNLVHVDDVCIAVLRSLELPLLQGESRPYNLAGADSPRWNEVLVDLALAIDATPVRRIHPATLRWSAWTQPALATLQRWTGARPAIEPVTPPLLALWRSQLRLDPRAAMQDLKIDWTPYSVALQDSAAWWAAQREAETPQVALAQGM
ncbi:MAG: NAD-dependent epimerase/dehydratase family protein [Comamonadaceae bacterium]|nr:MAG: NAD-dependent epimerase/dehydratase family protein [Comamonadaceae bacterium]